MNKYERKIRDGQWIMLLGFLVGLISLLFFAGVKC